MNIYIYIYMSIHATLEDLARLRLNMGPSASYIKHTLEDVRKMLPDMSGAFRTAVCVNVVP